MLIRLNLFYIMQNINSIALNKFDRFGKGSLCQVGCVCKLNIRVTQENKFQQRDGIFGRFEMGVRA